MWQTIARDLDALLVATDHPITTLANAAAFLFLHIERVNWLGFYLSDGEKLYLGPFAGKPACTTIEMGKGVCGTSALERRVIAVDDVDAFPGHIVCDAASRSEIVLPLILSDGTLFGVFDIDSGELSRFGTEEQSGLRTLRDIIVGKLPQNMAHAAD